MPKAKASDRIIQEKNPILRRKAMPIAPKDIGSKELRRTIVNMQRTLAKEPDGVAIAAPQIGVPLRLFVVSARAFVLAEEEKHKKEGKLTPPIPEKDLVCINPEITKLSKKKVQVSEGCLSIRWKYGSTMRHEKATLSAYDEKGKRFTYGGSGLIAQIFQHETDHLNGILFVDHATNIETLTPEQIAKVEQKSKEHHDK